MTTAFRHAVYTGNDDLSAVIPWGSTPEKTQGTQIFSEAFTVPPSAAVRAQFLIYGLHKTGTEALVACLFIDDQLYSVRTVACNPPGPGYFVPLALEYCHVPGDGLPHVYRVRVGPRLGVMAINGSSGLPGFGATMAATLTLEEK